MNEKDKTAQIAPVLGRAKYFAVYNLETKQLDFVDNPGVTESRGAGNVAARVIAELGVEKVITAHIGPNAQGALEAAEIEIVEEKDITLSEVIEKYLR